MNEYGSKEEVEEMRILLVKECDILSIFKGMKEYVMKESGVATKKMVSEILLQLAMTN